MIEVTTESITQVKIISTKKELRQLIQHCKTTTYCSFDFETSGEPYYEPYSYPTLMGVSFQPGSAWVIPLGHFDSPWKDCFIDILTEFAEGVFNDINITKIAQNAEFEYLWLKKYNLTIQGRLFDTMLAKHLLDENTLKSLEYQVKTFLPQYDGYKEQTGFKALAWDKKPLEPLAVYCATDCDTTFKLHNFYEPILIKIGLYSLYRNMLCNGLRVLGDAVFEGLVIDVPYLDRLVEEYQIKIDQLLLEVKSHKMVRRFDLYRIKQCKKQLIEEVEIEIKAANKELLVGQEELGDDDIAISKLTRSVNTRIRNREGKLMRYRAGEFTTNKELTKIAPFNMSSTHHLRQLFFTSKKGFNFTPKRFTMKKEGRRKIQTDNPSTDEDTLIELKADDDTGFIELLLKYRGLEKLFGTYIKGMRNKVSSEGKIHGSFLLTGTVTGRLSSRNPNLQNIPRGTTSSDIKRMFITPPGKLLMQLDYSQAELRVLAAAAGEKTMIEGFRVGRDIHLDSACKKYGEDYNKILPLYLDEDHPEHKAWSIKRKQAKTINFGIVYGQGAKALSESLSSPEDGIIVDQKMAQRFLDEFADTFPMIDKYIKKTHKRVKRDGFVTNVFGRKRRLPGIDDSNFGIKSKALRDSINAPIQGGASDYTLFSSILIAKRIKAQEALFKGLDYKITVHDSLIYYIDPEIIHPIVPVLTEICANPKTKEFFGFEIEGVTMKVDFEIGKHWGDLKGYKPEIDYSTWV